jgi:hypothetical protein
LLAHGRWFSPGTPASSTTKTGPHDIAEILLKVALKHQNKNKYYLIHYYIYQQYNILFNKLSDIQNFHYLEIKNKPQKASI